MKLFTYLSVAALGILVIPIFVFAETEKERRLCTVFRDLSTVMSANEYSVIPRINQIRTIIDSTVTNTCTATATTTATQESLACTNAKLLSKDLYKGVSNEIQVKYLQIFLNNSGTLVDEPSSPSNPGSLGYETNYFGTLTELAVKKWQSMNGVTSGLGRVDSPTRSKMVSVACSTNSTPTPTDYTTPTATVNNLNPKQGESVFLTWTRGTQTSTCNWFIDGSFGGSLQNSPTLINIAEVPGTYTITVSCMYPDSILRTSQPVTIQILPPGSNTPNPTPEVSCTGTHPQETQYLILSPYSNIVASPGTPNTTWKYGETSCGWHCVAPQVRNGNIGCKAPTLGSGVKVKVVDLTPSNPKTSGIKLSYGISGIGQNQESFNLVTNAQGEAPEFWFSAVTDGMSWTRINIDEPGYKIQRAVGCTPWVYVHGGKQHNQCKNAENGSPVTIYIVKGDISTQPVTWFSKTTYKRGEDLRGGIIGGDPFNTYACMSSPNDGPVNPCNNGSTARYRKLGEAGDDWKIISDGYGDRIELSSFSTTGYPIGRYVGYARTGLHGVSSQTSFTLEQ